MNRVLLVPAAGAGTRLGSSLPKLLTPVAGRPMIDHLIDRYRGAVRAIVLVVYPAARDLVVAHLRDEPMPVGLAEQERPTGMLDAIMAGAASVLAHRPERIWITWCDQVGISASTVSTLEQVEAAHPETAVVMPVVNQTHPYIHFDRDSQGRLASVRHRREGDAMPEVGTSDAGLFSLSRHAFERWLPEYLDSATPGARTGERNFLPFLPWLSSRSPVLTFEIPVDEAQGINTPQDLADVERRLKQAAAEGGA